jgi:hypothetical protein
MRIGTSDRLVLWIRRVCIVVLAASAVGYVVFTVHWPWMWDEQVFHYDVFLMQHGKVLYRDIYDLNLPGYLVLERLVMTVFGGGDLGWRMYEYMLLGLLTISGAIIARPYDWLAGLFGGVTFAVLHGIDGAAMAVERDEVVAVMLMAVFALLCIALRRGRAAPMIVGGFVLGMATLIKPTVAPFVLLFVVLLFAGARAHGRAVGRYAWFGLAGVAVAGALVLGFMLPESLRPFLNFQSKALPYYSSLGHADWMYMLKSSLPVSGAVLCAAALVTALWNPAVRNWEIWGVRAAVLLGALTYFVQRKGYTYHRYPLLAFALLWVGMEFCIAMKGKGVRKAYGAACLAAAVLLILPSGVNRLRHARHDSNPFADQLQTDLLRLGGNDLQGQVQCLDLVTGCYSALYRLGLMQSTGWMGDLQFFGPNDHKAVPYYRQIFWNQIHRDPPRVIVLSSEWFGARQYSFDKLDAWPQFREYLTAAYRLDVTRTFGSFDGNVLAYRIYVRRE